MNEAEVMESLRALMEYHNIERIDTNEGVLFQMEGDTLQIKQECEILERGHHLKAIK